MQRYLDDGGVSMEVRECPVESSCIATIIILITIISIIIITISITFITTIIIPT